MDVKINPKRLQIVTNWWFQPTLKNDGVQIGSSSQLGKINSCSKHFQTINQVLYKWIRASSHRSIAPFLPGLSDLDTWRISVVVTYITEPGDARSQKSHGFCVFFFNRMQSSEGLEDLWIFGISFLGSNEIIRPKSHLLAAFAQSWWSGESNPTL